MSNAFEAYNEAIWLLGYLDVSDWVDAIKIARHRDISEDDLSEQRIWELIAERDACHDGAIKRQVTEILGD